ncbi:reverse transcriptase [Phytophthora megakarya]|uniref:Reverse transcriptase n=1 Tax=Phytophthora megakarya TaxID=4795 RepID=A0A225V7M4_9STRA|nr:reverse transcriptase [Phytophthora megakarya]
MAQLQDPSYFKVLKHGELVDAGTQTEEAPSVTTRMDVATQVSEGQLDSYDDGDILDDDRGDSNVDTPPEWTMEFEEPQGGETFAEKALWFMSLDMVSGFWAIKMPERAKLISAFVFPFGHFQWIRMPFGLKNEPLIYEQVINNCLWGFVRLPPEEEAEVDQEVLDYLDLDPQDDGPPGCVSLPKGEFGILSIPYLSHEISAEGIRATPKTAKGVQDLPFPTTMKGVQSFLGSLNYYHKFFEDYPVITASLYELSDDQVRSGQNLSRAKQAFETCAVLGHEHDGLIQPVRFTDRVLHDAKLRYHIAEKEVITVLRWNLDVRKIQRDEDGLAVILGAGITPREHLDEGAEELIPAKGRAKPPPIISVEMLEDTFVLSFDGATKMSSRQGSSGCILWELPGWKILDAQGFILDDVTVNDAEYCGILNGLIMAQARGVKDLIAVEAIGQL